jgi:hypothetical protein
MATYYVSQSPDDNYDGHPERRFKYRYKSSKGKSTAQELFDKLKNAGEYVRLIKWDHHRPTLVDVANVEHEETPPAASP